MITNNGTPHEVISDGQTVWVNGRTSLLGRFGKNGIDIHRDLSEQSEKGECLFCTHEPTTHLDWALFKEKMKEHFGIEVGDEHMPNRFKLREQKCPRCDSKAPHLHPAVQFEGEVQVCTHEFHLQITPQNTEKHRQQVLEARSRG